eukprot:scaffold120942_cov30-Attheya_sp.AAC.1
MHIGREDKKSKTECMYFPAFRGTYQDKNTENITVGDGFVSFTKTFKYLGSLITSELNDAVDVSHSQSETYDLFGNTNKPSIMGSRIVGIDGN